MTPTQDRKTLADYVAIAISPVLIMALVGSLVFFLVEISYARGEHVSRLRWILFFFVFGAVLIARISMRGEIADRAGVYGLILGLLVWLALLMYVKWDNAGPLAPFGWLIDLGLIALVWWCAHRVTWDCTLIDDSVDASGAGLLQEAGLEKPSEPAAAAGADPTVGDQEPGFVGWWERFLRFREARRRRPHTPGVWVVYFSLAALPLFGLGQSRIPPDDVDRRQYVFWLMIIYVGSGLGLLVTTSFLGLRRYLRQRKLQMPIAMTGAWLALGGLLIAAFLVAGALLPRPNAEYRLLDEWLGGDLDVQKQQASRHAQVGDDPGKDQGNAGGAKTTDKDKDSNGKDGKAARDKPAKDGQADGKDGKPQDKAAKDAPARDARGQRDQGPGGQRKNDKGQDGGRKNEKDQDGQRQRDKDGRQDQKTGKRPGLPDEKKQEDGGQGKGEPERQDQQDDTPPKPGSNPWSAMFRQLSNILKWAVGIIAAVLVLIVLLRAGLKFLANFTHWARRLLAAFQAFWQGLLTWWQGGGRRTGDEIPEEETLMPPRPFASFQNPFAAGAADAMSPEQLVRYSFEALQAWAHERDLGRQTGETPLEFAARIGEELPALEGESRRLANFYVQIAYARGTLTRSCREPLRHFWQRLLDAVERPMSAGVDLG